jgi:nucleotide-binding universal stress UspA family protein
MQAKKILFPTDFSEFSNAALEQAGTLARESGAMLTILHVVDPSESFVDVGYGGFLVEFDEEAVLKKLNSVKPGDPAVRCEYKLLTGNPATEIARFAEKEGVDMIVLGTHGRRGLTRMLMGSVAEYLVRNAPCPVLTVKMPAREKTTVKV